jgi:hypothetical protein
MQRKTFGSINKALLRQERDEELKKEVLIGPLRGIMIQWDCFESLLSA